jgi:hypothetical protein
MLFESAHSPFWRVHFCFDLFYFALIRLLLLKSPLYGSLNSFSEDTRTFWPRCSDLNPVTYFGEPSQETQGDPYSVQVILFFSDSGKPAWFLLACWDHLFCFIHSFWTIVFQNAHNSGGLPKELPINLPFANYCYKISM